MLILPCCSVLSDGVCLSELKGLLTYLLTYLLTPMSLAVSAASAPIAIRRRRRRCVYFLDLREALRTRTRTVTGRAGPPMTSRISSISCAIVSSPPAAATTTTWHIRRRPLLRRQPRLRQTSLTNSATSKISR